MKCFKVEAEEKIDTIISLKKFLYKVKITENLLKFSSLGQPLSVIQNFKSSKDEENKEEMMSKKKELQS